MTSYENDCFQGSSRGRYRKAFSFMDQLESANNDWACGSDRR